MKLSDYLSARRGRLAQVAAELNIAPAWLSQMASGRRPIPPALVCQIERECEGLVQRWDLRPLDWHRIWPELIGAEGAPAIPEQQPREFRPSDPAVEVGYAG